MEKRPVMVDVWGWGQGEETWNEFCHPKTRNWGEPGWASTIWLQVSMVWKPDALKDIISALNESRNQGECKNFFASGIYRGPLSISQAYTLVGFYLPDSAHISLLLPFPAGRKERKWVPLFPRPSQVSSLLWSFFSPPQTASSARLPVLGTHLW